MGEEAVGTKMLTFGLEYLGSGAGENVSLRHQVTFTVRRSVEVLLLSPKKEEMAKAARHFSLAVSLDREAWRRP